MDPVDEVVSLDGCQLDGAAQKYLLEAVLHKSNPDFGAAKKVRSIVINKSLMRKASRFLRDQMLKLDRQHQLRSEALVWRGKKDYMEGPTVHTTVEEAIKKA